MREPNDHELLAEFTRSESEGAFTTLVAWHVNLVYSAALRFTGNPHHAEEITQAIFIILARKAGGLRSGTVLSGWLYQTARLTAANFMKGEIRRQRREQEAYMQSTLNEPDAAAWEEITPLLEEAMGRLRETDRDAIVLRFFENKTVLEVAATLKLKESAAHMRVARGLEKLRKFFAKRGVTMTATVIAGALAANSVRAAPAAVAKSVSAAALAKGAAASGSTLMLIKGTLKLMAWTKLKIAALAGLGILLISGTAIVAVKTARPANPSPAAAERIWGQYSQAFALGLRGGDPVFQQAVIRAMTNHPPMALIRPSQPTKPGQGEIAARGSRLGRVGEIGMREGHVAMGMPLVEMARYVFDLSPQFPQNRIILPAGLENTRYDYLDTMPKGGREILQRELKDQFGLVAKREMRPNQLLTVKIPDASGLRKHIGEVGSTTNRSDNVTMSQLAEHLGKLLSVEVLDQTGLAGGYDFTLTPRSPAAADLNGALRDQLGLELLPAADNQAVEFLVVQKVR